MKILNLSLDRSILDKHSALAGRVADYGRIAERYDLIVPAERDEGIVLSPQVTIKGVAGGNKLAQFFRIYREAQNLIIANKYDLITVQDVYYLACLGVLLSRKFHLGLEIQVHGFEKLTGLREILARYALARAHAVRTVSQRMRREMIDRFGVMDEAISVVPVYTERMDDGSVHKGGRDKFIFLTVGRLVPVKNISLQIEAMAEIVKEHPDTELWIIGTGPLEPNYKLQITNYKLNNNIRLLGPMTVEAIHGYYDQADVFLLTSNYEGWGMVIVEAASYSLPIIMTDVGCAGELIKHGESGLVIPVNDKKALARAMLRLIEEKELRARLGPAARESLEILPDKERTLSLYRSSWEKAISRKENMGGDCDL